MKFIGSMEDDDQLNEKSQIVIYGTGTIGKRLFDLLVKRGLGNNIVAFCDSNSNLWGTSVKNREVMELKEITRRFPHADYLVGSCCVRQITETLLENDIERIHIVRS